MIPSRTLRAVRRKRKLSQRELAEHARVSRSTIDRIESGRVRPTLDTFAHILSTVGFRLVAIDGDGQQLDVLNEHDTLRDRAWRRFPAHLEAHPVRRLYDGGWWGWGRIAWSESDETVPSHTYWQRPKPLE